VYFQKSLRTAILSVLVFIIMTSTACSASDSQVKPTSTPIPTAVVPQKPTYTVQVGGVTAMVEDTGRIAPVTQFSLFFRTDGRVRNVNVKEGDVVKKGQVLADLEVLNGLERRQAQSSLTVRRAEIQLEMAKLQLQMTESDAVTNHQKIFDIPMKKFEVELAQIGLDEANLNNEDVSAVVNDAQLVAPIDGTVISMISAPGGTAVAYKEAMVVADVNSVEVSLDLTSANQGQVDVGLPATLVPVSHPDMQLTGRVRKLPTYGSADTTSVTSAEKTTRISFDSLPPDIKLPIGERVDVKIILQHKDNVLYLPPQAIRTFEDRKFAVVQEGLGQKRVDLKIGIQAADRVEILEGLSEGQVVIAP
jgi:macrolide-specific efflux system membrane fusion protein